MVQNYKHSHRTIISSPEFTCPAVARVRANLFQSYPTLGNTTDLRPPGSSVHGILQARMLEWVALFSRGSSQPRDWKTTSLTSPALAGGFLTTSATIYIREWSNLVRLQPSKGFSRPRTMSTIQFYVKKKKRRLQMEWLSFILYTHTQGLPRWLIR